MRILRIKTAVPCNRRRTAVTGITIFTYGTTGSAAEPLVSFWAHEVAVDQAGNVYACDIKGMRVQKWRRRA